VADARRRDATGACAGALQTAVYQDPIADSLDGYRRIRDNANVSLAAGERMTIFGMRALIKADLVDVVPARHRAPAASRR
jgi:L-alanine-DL-glutamate epimerase-like enolase superfamily enzyme